MWKSTLAMTLAASFAFATLITPAAAQATAPSTDVSAAQSSGQNFTTGRPIARNDLALAPNDFPPGYEEGPSLDLQLFDIPLADRVIRRKDPGPGPAWIWTMTFQPGAPMTQARMAFIADDLTIVLTRSAADVAQLGNWNVTPGVNLGGEFNIQYTFSVQIKADGTRGDGTMALFGGSDYVSYLVVMNTDGQSASDLRDLAQIVNARINSDRATGRVLQP